MYNQHTYTQAQINLFCITTTTMKKGLPIYVRIVSNTPSCGLSVLWIILNAANKVSFLSSCSLFFFFFSLSLSLGWCVLFSCCAWYRQFSIWHSCTFWLVGCGHEYLEGTLSKPTKVSHTTDSRISERAWERERENGTNSMQQIQHRSKSTIQYR